MNKLLIANRGEIACRIMRSAQKMGIATVAVYSDADAKALHVRMADEAVHIGPSAAAESYLIGDKIIAAAKETGADAIHPGYGFLSENADFARTVVDAGLIWVGPDADSIEAMGLKDAAKERMIAAGVPVTPGYLGEDQSDERLSQEADAIGYPVLIKAVAGGGGKGMRKVDAAEDFAASLESCRREASASFGNRQVLLEKWITSPRHIEVQVFGDKHGNVVHLFERDCSLQRRHQKVIEEAPAPGMDEVTRQEICAAAVRAAAAVNYVGAGTIEFIADASEGLRADRIFFMEMNTRLQVEHPVTEEITGVDLVEWQLRVAAGEAIPVKQEELSINGHAIEARLYAEDPQSGFLPSIGRLETLHLESDGWGQRVESGVIQGGEVSPFYDPMIAKLIKHDDSRDNAIEGLLQMLEESFVHPLQTNMAFLYECVDCDRFRDADLDTGLIEQQGEALLATQISDALVDEAAVRILLRTCKNQALAEQDMQAGMLGFRLNAPAKDTATVYADDDLREAVLAGPVPSSFSVLETAGDKVLVNDRGNIAAVSIRPPASSAAGAAGDGDILAPMPGKVIAVDVAEGERVEEGQRLLVLEAMKMEHALTAPFAGTITQLTASVNAQVQVDILLVQVEQAED